MPADKNWIYDPTRNPYHNCPNHYQFEGNLVSWRLENSEVELTYDETENVMISMDIRHPAILQMDSVNQQPNFFPLLFGLVMIFA